MILNGIDYGCVWNASGARNFFGEPSAYWFHCPLRPFGLDWRGSTFVAKTTTLEPRKGNMPLGGPSGTTPREWRPKCIRVNWRAGAVLNAVGLSGPGLEALLRDGRWQMRLEPFLLSFMAVDALQVKRLEKARIAAEWIARERYRFRAPFALELNLSCPNVGLSRESLVWEGRETLSVVRRHLPDVPLLPKINALVPVDAAREIATHPACSALVVSNTLPWGSLPDLIDWRGLFGEVSPLAHLGGGGLSGAPLLPIVQERVAKAVYGTTPDDLLFDLWALHRRKPSDTFPVPIVSGGGVLSKGDAWSMLVVGASAVELGSVAILRPWRVRGIIRSLNRSQT